MGGVRRATWKQFLPFLALNVLVSTLTILLVLAVWGRGPRLPSLPPTPTFDLTARLASAIPTATATLPPSPTPVTYTVGPGDSLGAIALELDISIESLMAANGLANPDSLAVGQVLVIPVVEGFATAVPGAGDRPASPTAEGAPQVLIRGAYERGDLQTEFVYLENLGGVATMLGWTLDDGEGNVFPFPGFTLYNGGGVNVYTRAGTNSVINLYWGFDQPLWTPGKLITLRDAQGASHSQFLVPSG
jgi:hypothetical protein